MWNLWFRIDHFGMKVNRSEPKSHEVSKVFRIGLKGVQQISCESWLIGKELKIRPKGGEK